MCSYIISTSGVRLGKSNFHYTSKTVSELNWIHSVRLSMRELTYIFKAEIQTPPCVGSRPPSVNHLRVSQWVAAAL